MHEKVRPERLLRRVRRLGLILASVLVTLGALETGAWVLHSVIDGKPRLLTSDPELGWRHRRNLDTQRRLEDGREWQITLDADGRRTLDLPPHAGAPQLVALGDSFVFGDGVNPDRHFLHTLGTSGLNVVNLGVVGYSTDQELLAFQRYRGECDVVVLGTYLTNDLAGNLSHSGGHLLRFKPKFVPDGADLRLEPVQHPLLNRARHASYLATLGLGALYRVAPTLSLFDPPPPGPETVGDGVAWERYVALVDRVVREAARRSAERVVILLFSHHSSRPDPAAAPALRSRFGEGHVRVIDLDRAVRDLGIDPGTLYYDPAVDPGAHWNDRGHALVAQLVAEALGATPRPESARQSSR